MNKIKKRKLIFKNQVYKVYSNYLKFKSSVIKDYLSIEVKGKVYGGVCSILIYKNKIGLMKSYSPIINKYFFLLPQGFTDSNEDVRNAVKREVFEETGINIKKKDFKKICEFYPIQSLIKSKLAVFYSKIDKEIDSVSENIQDEIGVGRLSFFKYSEVKKMLKNSSSFDLISFSSLTYFFFEYK